MNCANHSDAAAVAYCRTCGKPLCNACARNVGGVVYCETCLAERMHGAAAGGTPMGAVPPPHTRPAVAAWLGFIPGVGAMYNGQFMKGVIHAVTFVVLIFLTTRWGLFGILVGFFELYMAFEAFKTAEAIQHGLPLPDPFGLEAMFGPGVNQTNWQGPGAAPAAGSAVNTGPGAPTWSAAEPQAYPAANADARSCNNNIPIGAVILIGLGCLLLLNNMGWFSFNMDLFVPLVLIAIGAWMFFKRWNRSV